ncbi:hypothetical protein [Aeromonas salmonicida]|uniref:hypothetical protein n=1 Tax=Aeromonas salmonicida TaxID=645 RepID=UPI00283A9C04|nr:hypothetical protein [Aeromonas salmonicida]
MKKLILVVDESGAKGYADQKENYSGETGVVAGFLFPESEYEQHETKLNIIRNSYNSDGKLHITDLDANTQKNLREDIIKYLEANEVVCVFEAMYVEGLHHVSEESRSRHQAIRQQLQSPIKCSANEKYELLHEKLFVGVFGKALAFSQDCLENCTHISVITDNIDEPVIKKISKGIDELLGCMEPKVTKSTGFDPVKKEVVTGTITSKIHDPSGILGDYSSIGYDIDKEDSAFTLVADVLANSIYRHLANREEDLTHALNTEASLPEFMNELFFYGLSSEDDKPYIMDLLYQHPDKII